MLAQPFLCQLHQPVHTARSLQHSGTGDGSNNNIDNVCRRCAWLQSVVEHEDGKAKAGNGSESKATVT